MNLMMKRTNIKYLIRPSVDLLCNVVDVLFVSVRLCIVLHFIYYRVATDDKSIGIDFGIQML